MTFIKFKDVTLEYPIYSTKSMSLKSTLQKISTGGILNKKNSDIIKIKALNNISFELYEGDSVGIIGHNGAGKTTLLRTIAGNYIPTSGKVMIEGTIKSIIDLGAGMDPELSGYENVKRISMLNGYSLREIKNELSSIEIFTELGSFLELPVRIYSSGMVMRLMFAIATAFSPEILIIDEMFGTGDNEFQQKAIQRIESLIEHSKIFIFASHSLDLINKYCNKIITMEHGNLAIKDNLICAENRGIGKTIK